MPPDVSRLEVGDFVEATIEHLVLPQAAADYYGPNEPLRAALATMQDSWRLVHREAVGNSRRVAVRKGRLIRLHPDVRVVAEEGFAEFTIAGGLGYVPITVTGLPTHRGGGFTIDGTPCDQAVHEPYSLACAAGLDGEGAWMERGLGWRGGLDGEGFPCKPEARARGIRVAIRTGCVPLFRSAVRVRPRSWDRLPMGIPVARRRARDQAVGRSPPRRSPVAESPADPSRGAPLR